MAPQVKPRNRSSQLSIEGVQITLSPDVAKVSERPSGVAVTEEKASRRILAPTSASSPTVPQNIRSMLDVDDSPQSTMMKSRPLPESCTPFIQEKVIHREFEELEMNSATQSSRNASVDATDSSGISSSLLPLAPYRVSLHLFLIIFYFSATKLADQSLFSVQRLRFSLCYSRFTTCRQA